MNDGVVVCGSGRDFQQVMRLGRHELRADEPQLVGGKDEGPSPYELLMAALGSCTSMTIGMYARRKGWPVEEISKRYNITSIPTLLLLRRGDIRASIRGLQPKSAIKEKLEEYLNEGPAKAARQARPKK